MDAPVHLREVPYSPALMILVFVLLFRHFRVSTEHHVICKYIKKLLEFIDLNITSCKKRKYKKFTSAIPIISLRA